MVRRAVAGAHNFSLVWCSELTSSTSRFSCCIIPPSHSKDNPIERCWGILEWQWNGAKLIDVETMLGWAKKMTWKGITPAAELTRKVHAKGIALTKAALPNVQKPVDAYREMAQYGDIRNKPSTT